MKKTLPAAFVIGLMLAAAQLSVAQAQSAEQPVKKEAANKDVVLDASNAQKLQEQIDALKEGIVQKQARSKELEARFEQHKKKTDEREEAAEEAEFTRSQEMSQLMTGIEEDSIRRINVYGFFNFTFYKFFFEDNSGFHLLSESKSSFAVTDLNLYFQSEPVDNVRFLSEINLTYKPDGYTEDFEVENLPGTAYLPKDTMVRDPYTTARFEQGGITLVRINLTYHPLDYFYIKAGKFITPYGIWNVDHGSPVVLPARLPYLQLRQVVPLAQTGLLVGGKIFPTDATILHYALTLSNGRGPSEPLNPGPTFDTDENKALGLRLRGTWQHREAQVSLGGYGYVGSQRTFKKVVTIAGPTTDPEGTVSEDRSAIVEVKDVRKNHEYVVTADFQLDWQGLRLQAEYVWLYIDFSVPAPRDPNHIIAKGGTPYVDQWYLPSHTGSDFYGLVAYTLPLQRLIGSFRITPYYLYERSAPVDTDSFETIQMHIWGINMAPWPELVLKLEVACVIPKGKNVFGERLVNLAAQMAVSF